MAERLRVAMIADPGNACDYYRIYNPVQFAMAQGHVEVAHITTRDDTDHIYAAFAEADVITRGRIVDGDFVEHCKALQKHGKKVIIDYDDDLFSVSPLSCHYAELGREEVKVVQNGKTIDLWTDGKNINLAENRQRCENVKRVVEAVDAITTTTEHLAKVFREFNEHVYVLPNCVNPSMWRRLPLQDDGAIKLWWSGGSSHFEDFSMLSEPLGIVMNKYPWIQLHIMGQLFKGAIKDLPADRIHVHPWVGLEAYPYYVRIQNPTIGLIPLQDTQFNRHKSAIKWTELSAMGVPSVVSNVVPYSDHMLGDNGVWVDNETDAWVEGMSLLIESADLRRQVGEEARGYVDANLDIEHESHRWVDVYKEVIANGN